MLLSRHLFSFRSFDYCPEKTNLNNISVSKILTLLLFKFIASEPNKFSLKSYFKLCYLLCYSAAQMDILSPADKSKLFFLGRKALKCVSKMRLKLNAEISEEISSLFEKCILTIFEKIDPKKILFPRKKTVSALSGAINKNIVKLQYCSVGYEICKKEIRFSNNEFQVNLINDKVEEIEKILPKRFSLGCLAKFSQKSKREINPILYLSSRLKRNLFELSAKCLQIHFFIFY